MLRIGIAVVVVVACLPVAVWLYFGQIANPRITRELETDPDGERARKVMLVSLPSGRRLPVNYLRKGGMVYAGADGRWWKELVGEGFDVEVLIRGERLPGRARAVLDDPAYTARIFQELRPNAIEGFGTLVEIRLAGGPAGAEGEGAP